MAEFRFPISPGDGSPQDAPNGVEYEYVSAENKWVVKSTNVTSQSTPSVLITAAPPVVTSYPEGTIWIEEATYNSFVLTGGAWVQINGSTVGVYYNLTTNKDLGNGNVSVRLEDNQLQKVTSDAIFGGRNGISIELANDGKIIVDGQGLIGAGGLRFLGYLDPGTQTEIDLESTPLAGDYYEFSASGKFTVNGTEYDVIQNDHLYWDESANDWLIFKAAAPELDAVLKNGNTSTLGIVVGGVEAPKVKATNAFDFANTSLQEADDSGTYSLNYNGETVVSTVNIAEQVLQTDVLKLDTHELSVAGGELKLNGLSIGGSTELSEIKDVFEYDPDTLTDGVGLVWNSNNKEWTPGVVGTIVSGTLPPTDIAEGSSWLDTTTMDYYILVDSAWIKINTTIIPETPPALPETLGSVSIDGVTSVLSSGQVVLSAIFSGDATDVVYEWTIDGTGSAAASFVGDTNLSFATINVGTESDGDFDVSCKLTSANAGSDDTATETVTVRDPYLTTVMSGDTTATGGESKTYTVAVSTNIDDWTIDGWASTEAGDTINVDDDRTATVTFDATAVPRDISANVSSAIMSLTNSPITPVNVTVA